MSLVINKIQEAIRDNANKIAIIHEDNFYTYQDLDKQSNKLAHYLGENNVTKNTNVAFLMRRSFDMLTTILAILKQGATYVPLDFKTPQNRIHSILKNVKPSSIISDSAFLTKIPNSDFPILTLRDIEYINNKNTEFSTIKNNEDSLIYIIYTSGSTGEPKGVMLTHANVNNHLIWLTQDFKFTSEDCFSFNSSMAFDFSVACTLLPLSVGAKILITSEEDTLNIDTYCRQLEKNKVSFAKWTPSYFKLIVDYVETHRPDFSAFRFIMLGGEELLTSYVERWLKVYPEHTIINEYGPTEAAVGITTHMVKAKTLNRTLHTIPIGSPAINSTLYVVNSQNKLVNDGEIGELLIGGLSVAPGYYNRPDLTQEKFIDDPFTKNQKVYRTGDLVKKLPDQTYLYVSRIDNQVKIDGYRVELNEIEHWLLQHPRVKHSKTIIEKHKENRPVIVSYLVTKDNTLLDFDELKKYLSNFLPQFMLPSHFTLVEQIPCNKNGKVDVDALRRMGGVYQENQESIKHEGNLFLGSIIDCIKRYTEISPTDLNMSFFSLGITSLLAVQIVNDINKQFNSTLKIQDLFAYPTPISLSSYLELITNKGEPNFLLDDLEQKNSFSEDSIAIIAMDCRLPGADSCEELWSLCKNGVESITHFKEPNGQTEKSKNKVYARGILNNIENFDADFFNFSPRDAHLSDPQHRLLIESAWIALEKAGYVPNPEDKHKIGIYVSMNDSTYLLNHNLGELLQPLFDDRFAMQRLMSPQCLATKIAYLLNCTGPSITIQTACSSSLVSIVLACQQLLSFQCNMALAGGISIVTPQDTPYIYQKGNIFSPDGHCKPFDNSAEGTVFSNGLGMIVLKRLKDAIRDNDSIISVIKGTNTNNDGTNKMSYTAPNIHGQQTCISSALKAANIDPESIQYVETHGTGTLIGDPIEIEALTKAFQKKSYKQQFCAVGSLKANIGHTHVAAGVAGLIKTALALQNKQIPPSINCDQPNSNIDWEHSPFYVNTRLQHWPSIKTPRRAGVSAFGVGGTNAHVILEESPKVSQGSNIKKKRMFLFSAKSKQALQSMHDNLINYLEKLAHTKNQNVLLANVAYTLQVGRKNFKYCTGVISDNITDVLLSLQENRNKEPTIAGNKPKLVFLFPGQGTQYINMALSLYQKEKIYKSNLDTCLTLASNFMQCNLKEILFPISTDKSLTEFKINRTEFTHPILFSVEYSLAMMLMSWGIHPDAMLGHSLGEYVAACVAGVFSLEDAIKLVCTRGQSIAKSEEGAMLSAPLTKEEALAYCNDEISIAAINTKNSIVFSGNKLAIQKLYLTLNAILPSSQSSSLCKLNSCYPFHTKLLIGSIKPFTDTLKNIKRFKPSIPYLSNVTGNWISEAEVKTDSYWIEHMLSTVLFSKGVEQIVPQPETFFLEIGPGTTLLSLVQRHITKPIKLLELIPNSKMATNHNKKDSIENVLKELWCHHYPINWDVYYKYEKRCKISLPTYPFQKKRYWFDEIVSSKIEQIKPALSNSPYHVPSWIRDPEPLKNISISSLKNQKHHWIIFDDHSLLSQYTIQSLKLINETVFIIQQNQTYKKIDLNTFNINPKNKTHYEKMIQDISDSKITHYAIIHFWSMKSNLIRRNKNLLNSSLLFDGIYSGLYTIQGFHRIKPNVILSTVMVTSQLHKVIGNEILEPLKSNVLSLCRVLPLENSNYRFNNIDIEYEENDTFLSVYSSNIINLVHSSLYIKKSDPPQIMAYRHQYSWNLTYKNIDIKREDPRLEVVKSNGVYLITGGLGAMGLTIADWLSKKADVNILLLTKTPFPEQSQWEDWLNEHDKNEPTSEKIIKLKNLINSGCRIVISSGDISDYTQMKLLIEATEKNLGKINGIFHLAGVPGEGLAVLKNIESMHSVLSVKIQGIQVLSQIFKKTKLDFVMCASSLTAIVGGIGQLDYCAANLYLDYFLAQHPFENCARLLTINWNSWSSIGMATNIKSSKKHEDLYSQNSVSPKQAMTFLEQIFNSDYEQIILSHFPPDIERKRIIEAFDNQNYKEEETNPSLSQDISETLKQIWQNLLGVKNINQEDTFYSLGGDSLLATQLLMALDNRFGIDLSLQELAHAHNLTSLQKIIETRPVRSSDIIVPLAHKESSEISPKTPLIYFIHPLGGTVLCYFPLTKYMANNSLFAIQDPELAQGKSLFSSLTEMAEYYSKKIQVNQPKGEIILVGYSFGGNVAMEMVSSLKKSGIKVKKVILIDSWSNLGDISELTESQFKLDDLDSLKTIKEYYGVQSHQYQSIIKRLHWLRSYTPTIVDVEIILLTAKELLPLYKKISIKNNGWTPYCTKKISKFVMDGDHCTMLQGSYVSLLGKKLNELIMS